jgi:hypothetical protein
MFVRRKEFHDLQQELYRLKRHVGNLTEQTETNTRYGKRNSNAIEKLKKEVDVDDGILHFYSLSFGSSDKGPKTFNLSQKVDAILKHLGLIESATLENKLVPAPKSTKKGKK